MIANPTKAHHTGITTLGSNLADKARAVLETLNHSTGYSLDTAEQFLKTALNFGPLRSRQALFKALEKGPVELPGGGRLITDSNGLKIEGQINLPEFSKALIYTRDFRSAGRIFSSPRFNSLDGGPSDFVYKKTFERFMFQVRPSKDIDMEDIRKNAPNPNDIKELLICALLASDQFAKHMKEIGVAGFIMNDGNRVVVSSKYSNFEVRTPLATDS